MKKVLISFVSLLICAFTAVQAQVGFAKNKLYNVIPAEKVQNALGYKQGSSDIILLRLNVENKMQQWTVSNLSSSFRFINPFDNKAIYARTDNSLGITENNGSDESQLWTIRQKDKFLQIFPTNSPDLILSCDSEGKLRLVDKRKYENSTETLFAIRISKMAMPEDIGPDLSQRAKTYWEDETCFEETKSLVMPPTCHMFPRTK